MLELVSERVDVSDLGLSEGVGLDEAAVTTEDEVLGRILVVGPFDTCVRCLGGEYCIDFQLAGNKKGGRDVPPLLLGVRSLMNEIH